MNNYQYPLEGGTEHASTGKYAFGKKITGYYHL
jgi:hypothetical protein